MRHVTHIITNNTEKGATSKQGKQHVRNKEETVQWKTTTMDDTIQQVPYATDTILGNGTNKEATTTHATSIVAQLVKSTII